MRFCLVASTDDSAFSTAESSSFPLLLVVFFDFAFLLGDGDETTAASDSSDSISKAAFVCPSVFVDVDACFARLLVFFCFFLLLTVVSGLVGAVCAESVC